MAYDPVSGTLKSRSLTLSYEIPVSKIARFWEALGEGKVLATRCKRCGRRMFPPQAACDRCHSEDIEWFEIKSTGRVVAFTHIVVRPASFQAYPVYTPAIAEFEEEGVRVFAWIAPGTPKRAIKVGMKVKIETRTEDGRRTWVLVPAE